MVRERKYQGERERERERGKTIWREKKTRKIERTVPKRIVTEIERQKGMENMSEKEYEDARDGERVANPTRTKRAVGEGSCFRKTEREARKEEQRREKSGGRADTNGNGDERRDDEQRV